jgi:N-acyl-L-homoserine lactone synthetase
MKVHIVTPANRGRYAAELREMHRLRHEIFAEELGWTACKAADGLDRDEFDDEHAVYLIAAEFGQVYGSVRLLPTWRRCMVLESFSEWLTPGAFEPAPDAWEWTRWAPGTVHHPRALIKARSALIVGALEFAASRGVRTYLTFCETKFVTQLIELGWEPEPLGLPRPFDQGTAIAVKWAVRPAQLAAARQMFRTQAAAAFEAPAWAPEELLAPALLEQVLSCKDSQFVDQLKAALTPAERALAGATVHGRA